jgi:hypothetical protein
MIGTKLLWTGLTIMSASVLVLPQAGFVGSIIMIIGCVLMWLDK